MLRVGVVMDLFPAKIQNTVKILCNFIVLALFCVLFTHSVTIVGRIKNVTREISSAMRIPMWTIYMSTMIGFGLSVLRTVQALVENFRHFNDKAETTIEATLKEAQAETMLASQDDMAFRQNITGGGAA
jgi:TRAP-type C4-dicarboxylate transport system permease small subunit